eukprot:EC725444.1.p1 GENE.EC725444.1~~EC725444.1.p1  ORF type:complete len:227 (+),score=64.98 EC725444.1:53-682(+)
MKRASNEGIREAIGKVEERNALLTTLRKRIDELFPQQPILADPVSHFQQFSEALLQRAAALAKLHIAFESKTRSIETLWTAKLEEMQKRVSDGVQAVTEAENRFRSLSLQLTELQRDNAHLRTTATTNESALAAARKERVELTRRCDDLANVAQAMRDKFAQVESISSKAQEAVTKLSDAMAQIDKLKENNRVLILEVEDRKTTLEKVT